MRTLRALLVASAPGVPGSLPAQDHDAHGGQTHGGQTHDGQAHGGHAPAQEAAPASPYVGEEGRTIKALSPEEVADLRAGRGMGLALAAELDGFPGPLHVLELADALALSPDQRARTEAILAAMQEEAVALGEGIVAEEAAPTRSSPPGRSRPRRWARPRRASARIGALGGELRAVHLGAHLRMMDVLEPAQVAAYARLRGYEGAQASKPET